MTRKQITAKTTTGLTVVVVKNFYNGLWEIRYSDSGVFAGPFKTKREAAERLAELTREAA